MYLSPIQKTSKFNREKPELNVSTGSETDIGGSGNTDGDLKSEKQTDAAGNIRNDVRGIIFNSKRLNMFKVRGNKQRSSKR